MNLVQSANKYVRDYHKSAMTVLRRDGKIVKSVLRAFSKAKINVINVYLDSHSYNIGISGSRADLDIMFGTLRRLGFTPSSRPVDKNPTYAVFWTLENSSTSIWISFASTSCRKVQVGTKTEEVPVYDIVCEE